MLPGREDNEIRELRRKVRNQTQQCYNPGCTKMAIRSHIHQKEGPLREIASQGKVVQLEMVYFRKSDGEYRFTPKGIGDGDVLKFWGFCNECDTKIFRAVETGDPDYRVYKIQLLYSYRALVNELYKMDYNIKWYEEIFKSRMISDRQKNLYRPLHANFRRNILFFQHKKQLIESELKRSNGLFSRFQHKEFEFAVRELRKIEICVAACVTFPIFVSLDSNKVRESLSKNSPIGAPIAVILINLIPCKNSLRIIIGQNSNPRFAGRLDLTSLKHASDDEFLKTISRLILVHTETWCISISLYNTWKARGCDTKILQTIRQYFPISMKQLVLQDPAIVDFNMFDCT